MEEWRVFFRPKGQFWERRSSPLSRAKPTLFRGAWDLLPADLMADGPERLHDAGLVETRKLDTGAARQLIRMKLRSMC
jgi:hypothetical protein